MSPAREFVDYVKDILDAIEKAAQFTEGMDGERFRSDQKTVFAVIRALEVIGEAVKNIPAAIRGQYPHVPWREIAGIRDKLIHEYFGADVEVIWKTAQVDLPLLKPIMEQILSQLTRSDKRSTG